MTIHLGRTLLCGSCCQPDPSRLKRRSGGFPVARDQPARGSYLALLPVGLAVPPLLPGARWALTPPFHPYPACRAVSFLWRFPSGCPARALPGTVTSGSPDFPLGPGCPDQSSHPAFYARASTPVARVGQAFAPHDMRHPGPGALPPCALRRIPPGIFQARKKPGGSIRGVTVWVRGFVWQGAPNQNAGRGPIFARAPYGNGQSRRQVEWPSATGCPTKAPQGAPSALLQKGERPDCRVRYRWSGNLCPTVPARRPPPHARHAHAHPRAARACHPQRSDNGLILRTRDHRAAPAQRLRCPSRCSGSRSAAAAAHPGARQNWAKGASLPPVLPWGCQLPAARRNGAGSQSQA